MATRLATDALLDAWAAEREAIATVRDLAETELLLNPGSEFAAVVAILLAPDVVRVRIGVSEG